MGQFLIAHSSDANAARAVFAQALEAYDAIAGIRPFQTHVFGSTAVAVFAPAAAAGTPIVESDRKWALGAGTWFCNERTGTQALNHFRSANELDGCFAVAAGDRVTGDFRIITDRLGRFHVYEALQQGCTLVSTSSVILAAVVDAELDLVACREFLATGTVFEDRSLFRGIKKLEPASEFAFRNGVRVGCTRYWNLADVMYDRAPRRGGVAELADSLEHALAQISTALGDPLLDLTGGFDSRVLLGAMLRTGRSFETVAVGSPNDPDVQTANRIADEFRLIHHNERLPADWPQMHLAKAKEAVALCDGECDVFEYAAIAEVHRRLAYSGYRLSVNGSGGEICKGYWWELLFPFTGARGHFNERRLAAGRFVFRPDACYVLDSGFEEDIVDHFAAMIRRTNAGFERHPNTAAMDNVYLTMRMQRWQGRISSATSRIWPCVSPFMLREPMEIALSVPPRERVRHRFTRRVIEHLNRRLAELPLAQGYPALPVRPGTILHFSPLAAEMMRKALRKVKHSPVPDESEGNNKLFCGSEISDLVNPARMLTRDLYQQNKLTALLPRASDSKFSLGSSLARVLTLELTTRTVKQHAFHGVNSQY